MRITTRGRTYQSLRDYDDARGAAALPFLTAASLGIFFLFVW